MDVKAAADGVLGAFSTLQSIGARDALLFVALLGIVLWVLRRNGPGARLFSTLRVALVDNWQLSLLATTGFVLSIAAGYRTWDGMYNFTGESVMSAFITFGIQGVMLITAWLIGESFATGMNQRAGADGRTYSGANAVVGMMLGALLFGCVLLWVLQSSGAMAWTAASYLPSVIDPHLASNVLLMFALATLVLGIILLNRSNDIAFNYIQSIRIIVKNAVLWVMFLFCMGASVFFSFDSFFTAIFPKEERARAAELRAQNQVAGVVADIGATIDTRRQTEVRTFFTSKGWTDYERNLVELANAAEGSGAEIEKYFNSQLEDRNRARREQQERITSSESTQAGLASRKTTLIEELSRLKGERGTLAADQAEKKTELDARGRGVDAKRVEAMAEEKGAEGTGKVGKGPVFRQRQEEMAKLQAAYKIQEDRVRDADKRLATTDQRIAQLDRELAQTDGDLAKLKGEATTAQQRIQMLDENRTSDDSSGRIDPARMRPAFEKARTEFRQTPTIENLAEVQRLCSQIHAAMSAATVTKPKVARIDCDPKSASDSSAVLFALNAGTHAFATDCQGGDKLNRHNSADALFAFARKCLADSGLPSRETDALRTKINTIELARDDKAHRFVVTWNAFSDGNRLAYLALTIAIAIDSLVFMSGLFGANAVRSPLSDVPSTKARSAKQLESIIDTALLPHTYESARLVLGAMKAMTPRDGYMARVTIWDDDPHADDLRRVLNAGATIGAVRHVDGQDHVYEVRSELYEYLSWVTKKQFEANEQYVNLAELERIVSVALQPDIGLNAQVVLDHMDPLDDPRYPEFTSEIRLDEIEGGEHRAKSRNVLNAGSALRVVRPGIDDNGELIRDLYFLHADFYKTIARIRARTLMQDGSPRLSDESRMRLSNSARHGGAMRDATLALPSPTGPGPKPDSLRARIADSRSQARQDPAVEKGQAGGASMQPAPRFTGMPRQSLDEEARERLRSDYWGRLLAAIDLDLGVAAERLNDEVRGPQAFAAWDALAAHAQTNKSLRQLVTSYKNDQEALISEEYSVLRSEIDGDEERLSLLHDVEQEVQSHLPALMMFPENGLIRRIIAHIEDAAAPDAGLRPGEQPLKDRLKALLREFERRAPAAE